MKDTSVLIKFLRDAGHPLITKRSSPFVDRDTAKLLREAADLIEELQAKLKESAMNEISALGQAQDAYEELLEVKGKLSWVGSTDRQGGSHDWTDSFYDEWKGQ